MQGATQATAAKNVAHEILLGSLPALANYVQGVSNNALVTLRPSGFQTHRQRQSTIVIGPAGHPED